MTLTQKNIIKNMREDGKSYDEIAKWLDISINTVKSHCQRNKLSHALSKPNANTSYCKQCGQVMEIIAKRKLKKFCSNKCRSIWWAARPELVNRKATYSFTCAYCRETFTAYGNKGRKFCNHSCYIASRFGKIDRLPCDEPVVIQSTTPI